LPPLLPDVPLIFSFPYFTIFWFSGALPRRKTANGKPVNQAGARNKKGGSKRDEKQGKRRGKKREAGEARCVRYVSRETFTTFFRKCVLLQSIPKDSVLPQIGTQDGVFCFKNAKNPNKQKKHPQKAPKQSDA